MAVLADQPPSALAVLRGRADEVGASVLDAHRAVRVLGRTPRDDGELLGLRGEEQDHHDLFVPLLGLHQAGNMATAVTAAEAFLTGTGRSLGPTTVRHALARVASPGRLETVRDAPRVWVDGSHNPAGMAVTVAAVRELPSVDRLVVVLAVLDGKDADGMLHAMRETVAEVVVTENASPRRMPAAALAARAVAVLGEGRVTVVRELSSALREALRLATGAGRSTAVLVTGSVVTAGEAGALLHPGGTDDGLPGLTGSRDPGAHGASDGRPTNAHTDRWRSA